MPSLFTIGSYRVFFWSSDGDEPVHVHVAQGAPRANATKVWLTRSGGCIIANNDSGIPSRDLAKMLIVIAAQHGFICEAWKKFFAVREIDFFC